MGDSVAVAQCVAQELGHAQLSINSESYSRRDMGFQAVCIGHMLCKKYGVDTQNFAINRIPEGLASKEPKEIRAELSKTRNAMAEIHSHISDANTHTCPVCTGMPGSLPVLNKQVVEYAMAVGVAMNCEIMSVKSDFTCDSVRSRPASVPMAKRQLCGFCWS